VLVIFLHVRVQVKTDGYNVLLEEKIIGIFVYLPLKPINSIVTRLYSIREC